jgi:two-component system, OmpR family, phosphate regulon response regulator PhoB
VKRTLLMIEDDQDLGSSLKRQLESHDFIVLWAKSLKEFSEINTSQISAAIVDLNLPDGSGFSAIEKLKVPAVIMTALNSPENRLKGAEEGAYDFIPKPFLFQELHIKLKRLLENVNMSLSLANGFVIDFTSRTVDNGNGDIVFLSDKEFQILKLLVEKAPAVMSRDDILNVLKEPESASHRTIDNVVVKLRQILADEDHNFIKSIRSVGYQWTGSKNE